MSFYLDGLLKKEDGDEHPEELAGHSGEPADDCARVEDRQHEEHQRRPNAHPVQSIEISFNLDLSPYIFDAFCRIHSF